jgi:hypothetical protein
MPTTKAIIVLLELRALWPVVGSADERGMVTALDDRRNGPWAMNVKAAA